jgi:hypothetical protein
MADTLKDYSTSERIKTALLPVGLGVLIGVGMAVADWVIPTAPRTVQVVVCAASSDGAIEICRDIESLRSAEADSK